MGKMKNWLLGALALYSAAWCGCSSDPKEGLKECQDYAYVDSVSSSHVYGYVCDADGKALANVLVISGKDTTLTGDNGVYSFDSCRTVNSRCVVQFMEDEYFTVVRTGDISSGEARVDAVLMPLDSREGETEVASFSSSEGATIEVGKMKISIPANALVYENGQKEFNGSVCASVYYLNPNSENFAKEMPGGDMSGVTVEGKSVILLSYGMVEVTLKDSLNQKLQLKEGMESTMSFPTPDGFAPEQLYDEIPLWYFDEEKGTWVEEGLATKDGDSYSGKVKHFSWHNLDYPSMRATIRGRVLNKDGKPLPDVLVMISQTCARSDSAGYYSAYVPNNTPVFVTVRPSDYANCTNMPIYRVRGLRANTVYNQDVILPTVKMIHGKVKNGHEKLLWGVSICVNGAPATVTNYRGRYTCYFSGYDPIMLSVGETALNSKREMDRYEFKSPSEIDENHSYDLIFDSEKNIRVRGEVVPLTGRRKRIKQPVFVTVDIDGTEYKVSTSPSGWYNFRVDTVSKKITTYVKADDGFGEESNRVSRMTNEDYMCMPMIFLPDGISVYGSVINTCGPSIARVTIESGRGKHKKVFTQCARWGYFDFTLPLNMKGADAKVKINCQKDRTSKKFEIDGLDVNLGSFEVCSMVKREPNCIYVFIGDKMVTFDTRKGPITEMFQKSPRRDNVLGSEYKYQAWYKSPDTDATLVFEIDSLPKYERRPRVISSLLYLISDDFNVSRNLSCSFKDSVYTFKTEFELSDNKNEDLTYYFVGSADLKYKRIEDYLDMNYLPKDFYWNASKMLVGVNDSTKVYSFNVNLDATHKLEISLKENGFKEKSTFMDDEQRISSIFLQDNAEAILHRNKQNTDVTILTRDGIGMNPLYNCWKVDFRNSSVSKKGGVDYLWKNEADIAQLVMFGPMMGVKFTKAADEKCGCFEGIVPPVASK